MMLFMYALLAFVVSFSDLPCSNAGDSSVSPASPASPASTRRLVFATTFSLNWAVLRGAGAPSGEVSAFIGASQRPLLGVKGRAWNSALGYQLSATVGGADYYTVYNSWSGDFGLAYHRHHLAVLGVGGPHQRMFYNFGGGLLLWRTTPLALEADLRLGMTLNVRRNSRLKGVIGGQARVIGVIGGQVTSQLGIFAGLLLF